MINSVIAFIWKSFRRYFIVGVFTVAPFALTIYIVLILATWFDALFQPPILVVTDRLFGFDQPIPGLGIIIGLAVILGVGMAAPSFIGKQIVALTEAVVKRIPFAKMIYIAARQVLDAIAKPGAEKFNRVVMVPFLKDGLYAMGFVTQETKASWVPNREDHKLAVFVPTTPNPTSGYLIFIDPKDTTPLALSVEEGLRVVISGALAKPDYLVKEEARLQATSENPVDSKL